MQIENGMPAMYSRLGRRCKDKGLNAETPSPRQEGPGGARHPIGNSQEGHSAEAEGGCGGGGAQREGECVCSQHCMKP